jgi:hypothetical protein
LRYFCIFIKYGLAAKASKWIESPLTLPGQQGEQNGDIMKNKVTPLFILLLSPWLLSQDEPLSKRHSDKGATHPGKRPSQPVRRAGSRSTGPVL